MKKLLVFGLAVFLAFLSACTGGSQHYENPSNTGQALSLEGRMRPRPEPQISTSDDLVKVPNADGSFTMGEITLPGGRQVLLKWMPMTMDSTRGAKGTRGETDESAYSDYDRLIAAETEAIGNDPRNIAAYINRASLLFDRGKFADLSAAVLDCEEILKIDASEEAAKYLRGLAYAKLHNYDKALQDLLAILNTRDYMNIGIYYVLGQVYSGQGKTEQAIEMLENVVKADPDFYDAADMLNTLRGGS